MIELRIHHRNNEEQATMRDELCRSLVGWKPFIDSEVAVCDPIALDPEPITRLVLGPSPTKEDESVVVLDVKAEDMMCCAAEYVLPEGYPIPKMYDKNAEDNRTITTVTDLIKRLLDFPIDAEVSLAGNGHVVPADVVVNYDGSDNRVELDVQNLLDAIEEEKQS